MKKTLSQNKDLLGCGCLLSLLYVPFGVLSELTKKYSGSSRRRRR